MTRSESARPPVVADGEALAERVQSAPGLLVGLDFDGTLAPIVTDPDAATVAPAVVEPLERLVADETVTVAIVSGRALADLEPRVPVDGPPLAGNHGLERRSHGERVVVDAATDARQAMQEVRDHLAAALADVPGTRIEDKELTLSVHVRETPGDCVSTVRAAVASAVTDHDSLRYGTGKAVFEIRPTVDWDKGTAIATLAADTEDGWLPLYLGDDTTDEDAFRAIQPAGIGVHVGDDPDTAAAYALPDQSAVAPFLSWLASDHGSNRIDGNATD